MSNSWMLDTLLLGGYTYRVMHSLGHWRIVVYKERTSVYDTEGVSAAHVARKAYYKLIDPQHDPVHCAGDIRQRALEAQRAAHEVLVALGKVNE